MIKHLVINADDFGFSTEVNHAIMESMFQQLCSSTTIMANMPGFEEACQLSHDNKLTNRIGVHLVLSEGSPLTDEIKKCLRFCSSEGRFLPSGREHFFKLSTQEKNAVAKEISAQIDRCRLFGLPLTHVDSHQHMHVEWGIMNILVGITVAKGIKYIRLARHKDPDSMLLKNLYRRLVNTRIMLRGSAATKYFGTIEDFTMIQSRCIDNPSSFEIMIHPVYDREKMLIDNISKKPLNQYVTMVNGYKGAVSFSQLSDRSS